MGNKRQLALPAEVDTLSAFQDFIDESCIEAGLDEESSYDIKLAVDEACANIIQHGYAGMEPGTIVVSFQYGAEQVVIRITDFGHPFEISEMPEEPDPQKVIDGTSGGYGIYFIYRTVDSVNYDSTESGNTLTFVKKLRTE